VEDITMDSVERIPDHVLDMLARRFRLLSETTRLRILHELLYGEKTVNELIMSSGTSQANVSKQLNNLMDGGLISRRKVGVYAYYRIVDQNLKMLCDIACRSLVNQGEQVVELLTTENPTWVK
jgi:DNA-binding transcriptional ArsR family regulator